LATARGQNFKTQKPLRGKPSDDDENHVILTEFYIEVLSDNVISSNAVKHINLIS
jgi:hypothetical protein